MSKHTPGPWEVETYFDPGYKFISAPKHSQLAQVVWCMEGEDRSPECEANAYLIAAAPDLYEALQSLTSYVEQLETLVYTPDDTGTHESVENARAAIAKAKGENNE